jgi:serine/threonine-protein kinase HipA
VKVAEVQLWGRRIGAVSSPDDGSTASFQYDPEFAASGIQIAPLVMPLREAPYRFPNLNPDSFYGLPGLLADSLPDKYGQALIDAWLAGQGRTAGSFVPVERLCYIGRRGMGALEFRPAEGPSAAPNHDLRIDALVELASEVLSERQQLSVNLADGQRRRAMRDILQVGTSAGGARAKALIAYNPETGKVRSGQLDLDPGFGHWLLKLDGVKGNKDRDILADPQGYGMLEYAYSLMAVDADVRMTECRLLPEGGRWHFMTRRFDRTDTGGRVHVQTLGALAHLDYKQPNVHSYEQAFHAMRQLDLDHEDVEQMFRRMVFNVVARNQDDHVKNLSFTMNQGGTWELAPAYDVTWAYNASGPWTSRHQMSVNGKRNGFTIADFDAVARVASLSRGLVKAVLEQTIEVVSDWPKYAERVNVPEALGDSVAATVRLSFPDR